MGAHICGVCNSEPCKCNRARTVRRTVSDAFAKESSFGDRSREHEQHGRSDLYYEESVKGSIDTRRDDPVPSGQVAFRLQDGVIDAPMPPRASAETRAPWWQSLSPERRLIADRIEAAVAAYMVHSRLSAKVTCGEASVFVENVARLTMLCLPETLENEQLKRAALAASRKSGIGEALLAVRANVGDPLDGRKLAIEAIELLLGNLEPNDAG